MFTDEKGGCGGALITRTPTCRGGVPESVALPSKLILYLLSLSGPFRGLSEEPPWLLSPPWPPLFHELPGWDAPDSRVASKTRDPDFDLVHSRVL